MPRRQPVHAACADAGLGESWSPLKVVKIPETATPTQRTTDRLLHRDAERAAPDGVAHGGRTGGCHTGRTMTRLPRSTGGAAAGTALG
jgi:hypothetical protein